MNTDEIDHVVIVGGGTAGWLTAAIIAASEKKRDIRPRRITVIESPDIPIIGVGEGTWPTLRTTLSQIGVSETDFLKACDASFKQGSEFRRWVTGTQEDSYYHPFELPESYYETDPYLYQAIAQRERAFADSVSVQPSVCNRHLSPKTHSTPPFAGVTNYAYHLDAGKLCIFLRDHCTQHLNVTHIPDSVVNVSQLTNGDIKAVETREHGAFEGDLFVDCTGFKALLLGEHLGIDVLRLDNYLFANRAVTAHIGYRQDQPICSHTISTAEEAGWIWDIGLRHRRGVGYVFSSDFSTEDLAQRRLEEYIEKSQGDLVPDTMRFLSFSAGHRQKFWHRNCVAVGLSAGFVEPLEASAIVMIELSARMIADQFPATRNTMDIVARRFNEKFTYRWSRIVEFLKLHYVLSHREEDFWVENRRAQTIPERLQELLALWRYHPASREDFDHRDEIFPAASYQYILYGMGYETRPVASPLSDGLCQKLESCLASVARREEAALSALLSNVDALALVQAQKSEQA